MLKSYLLFLFLFISYWGLAQDDFQEGIITRKDGKVIYGFLKSQPTTGEFECWYKSSEYSEVIHYFPSDIKEFEYSSGRKFVSNQYKLKVDTLHSQFVEQLVKGAANLFYSKGLYYLSKLDKVPVLINWNQAEEDNSTRRGNLSLLLSDCNKIKSTTRSLDFDHDYLIALIARYNRVCYDSPSIEDNSNTYLRGSSLSFDAGVGATSISINSEGSMGVPVLNAGASYGHLLPTASNSLAMQYRIGIQSQKLEVYNDLHRQQPRSFLSISFLE
jgi:hypothetical protein